MKRQRSVWEWDVHRLVVLGLLAGVAVSGLAVGAWLLRATPVAKPSPTPVITTYKGRLGKQVTAAGYNILVSNVRTDVVGSSAYRPGDGYRYKILTITVTNTGNRQMAVAPVVQTDLLDQAGQRYQMAPAPLTTPFEAGTLAPGASLSGELSYSVADAAQRLTFEFAPGAGLKPAAINLSE